MPSAQQLPDERLESLEIDDLDTVKAIAEPTRMRIMTLCADHERTVKELAGAIGVPQTRLYYHVKLLCRLGLIRIASTRMVSGIEERSYISVAKSTTISPSLMASIAGTGVIGAFFDMIAADVEVALAQGAGDWVDAGEQAPLMSLTTLHLRPSDVEEVQRRLEAIMADFGAEPAPDKAQYHVAFAAYRLGGPDAP